MRFVVTTFAAMLVFTLLPLSGSARAVAGYDSDYAGESAFLAIAPGQAGQFTVFFMNTGTTEWRKNTESQVNLAICREDKTTCNVLSANAAWNDGSWLSQIAYATTTQDVVVPNQLGTFTYNIKPPFFLEHADYRFNGDLVHGRTLQRIHPQGYYQIATIG